MNPTPVPDEEEIIRQVQRLAGRAFLACLNLEEHLKQMLTLMAKLQIGGLTPADAEGVLNGNRRLTSGQTLADIRKSLGPEQNWTQLIETAVDARNHLIHHIPFSRWAVNDGGESLTQLRAEVKTLTQQISTGVKMIRLMMKGIGEVVLHHHPELRSPEWQQFLEQQAPRVKVVTVPAHEAGPR